jgi:hypothetical protein
VLENQTVASLPEHRPQQRQCAADIAQIIFLGIADRLADLTQGRKMHHGHDLMGSDRIGQSPRIANVTLHEWAHFTKPRWPVERLSKQTGT